MFMRQAKKILMNKTKMMIRKEAVNQDAKLNETKLNK
jgi:hypothetical protein